FCRSQSAQCFELNLPERFSAKKKCRFVCAHAARFAAREKHCTKVIPNGANRSRGCNVVAGGGEARLSIPRHHLKLTLRDPSTSLGMTISSNTISHLSESLPADHRDLSEIPVHPVQMRHPSNSMAGTLPFRKNGRLARRTPVQSTR